MTVPMNPQRWRWVGRVVLATALLRFAVPIAHAQADATPAASAAAYVPTMTFDVASVRENKQADINLGITMSGQFTPHTTHLRLTNWDIENILTFAYGIDRYQVVGAPHWTFPTVFVVEAKGDGDADAKMATLSTEKQRAEQEHMMQALLADRFKLQAHWETKQGDVFHLVVAKGGPKLGAAGSNPPSADELKIFGDRPVPELRQKNDGQGYDFIAHECPMADWVGELQSQFGKPVIDQTGLTGKYDFVVKYKGRYDGDRRADDLDPTPPLDRAIQEQLGLKAEPAKGPVKVLVIDHIEMPSEN
jgi:uncharacterized protein (TIGR03435 family)